ncbi:MAG: hypothetical protein WAM82_32630 [Thermoanaerobaculia bacterium]
MYRALPRQLYSIADGAKRFCREQWGISSGRIQVEKPIIPDINFVTTLHAAGRDFHWLCIEVSESPYYPALDTFVLECKNKVLPVKLYVAVPQVETGTFKVDLARARSNGVGVIEISDVKMSIIQEALPLSLTGVRAPTPGEFPAKYRQAVAEAVSTFRSGNPAKGCAVLYDELEALTRSIAEKATKRNFWRGAAPSLSGMVPWAKLVKGLMDNFDPVKSNCPDLKTALFARVLGMTPQRNEVSHKPKNIRELMKRDSQLRTRFESISDLLKDLITASKTLRV